jgi:membrane-associated phospholipid phosphatase
LPVLSNLKCMRAGRPIIATWVTLVVAGSLLAFAVRGAGPLPGDLVLSRLIQQPPPGGLLGSSLVRASDVVWLLLPLAVLVALVGRRWLAAHFILLASSTGILVGVAIKQLVARPRPTADLVRVYDTPESYAFPSTTAFFAAVFLGMIGYLIWQAQPRRPDAVASGRRAIVTFGIMLLLLLSSGLSRVYVGAHWATDILGGWLLGGAWLFVLIALHRWWLSRGTKAGDPTRRRRRARR